MENLKEVLPSRLRQLRKNAELTQGELAERLGVGRTTVSQWEHLHKSPPLNRVIDIACALGVGVPDLLGIPSEAKPEKRSKTLLVVYDADGKVIANIYLETGYSFTCVAEEE